MRTTATVTPIGPTQGSKFVPHKMLAAGTPVPASAENPDLVNKIAFFQLLVFAAKCKYTVSSKQMTSNEVYNSFIGGSFNK